MTDQPPTVPRRAERRASRPGWRPALVWAMWAVSTVWVGVSVATAWSGESDLLPILVLNLAALSFATTGAILVSRLPHNGIGWLLASGGLCFALGTGASSLADAGLTGDPGSVPGAIWFAWLGNWVWAPAIGTIIGLVLVYPTGRLMSRHWRPVAFAAAAVIALVSLGGAVGPWPEGQFPVDNPLLVTGWFEDLSSVISVVVGPLAVLIAFLAVASMVLRYRRSVGVERQQLKWFAFAAAVSVPAFLVTTALYGAIGVAGVVSNVAGFVAYCGFALLPVAIGIAVLRYRLYEIDRIISRTISYATMTGILVVAFAGAILLFQSVLAPVTGGSSVAVAASTLVVAALFQPLRRWVQSRVDRRFNRTRYDAERVVDRFAGRLRDEVDLGQLAIEIKGAVERTVQPVTVTVWLAEARVPPGDSARRPTMVSP